MERIVGESAVAAGGWCTRASSGGCSARLAFDAAWSAVAFVHGELPATSSRELDRVGRAITLRREEAVHSVVGQGGELRDLHQSSMSGDASRETTESTLRKLWTNDGAVL
jgi:hypothetical protein